MTNTSGLLQGIDCLSCERLSSDMANIRLVEGFFNRRNDGIAQTLRNEAFYEDEEGSTAYYVVKHPKGEILFFFSLKCGLLYDHFLDTRQLKLISDLSIYLEKISTDNSIGESDKALIAALQEKLRTRKGITKADIEQLPDKGDGLLDDIEREFNDGITRVGQTFSAVELVHFCANDNTEELWKSLNIPQSRGSVVFWQFVVPIIISMRQQVGCKYLYLFAADTSEDGRLQHYYSDMLNFEIPEDLSTAKPVYDFSCIFMCQEVNKLSEARDEFMKELSIIEDPV